VEQWHDDGGGGELIKVAVGGETQRLRSSCSASDATASADADAAVAAVVPRNDRKASCCSVAQWSVVPVRARDDDSSRIGVDCSLPARKGCIDDNGRGSEASDC